MRRSFKSSALALTHFKKSRKQFMVFPDNYGFSVTLWGRARRLAKRATQEEQMLCLALRAAKIKFQFQYVISPCIIDFYIPKSNLCIELDGRFHRGQKSYDADRTNYLTKKGFVVIRFWNSDVRSDILGVMNVIKGYLNGSTN